MHAADTATIAWWIWPLALFVVTFLLGIVAVIAGVGGGVLFVPIVGSFFPFHLDFVRGAGVLLALAGALAAAPRLLRDGLASLRLAIPVSLAGSLFSIVGALASFAVPTQALETSLGVLILLITGLMLISPAAHSHAPGSDPLAAALGLHGSYLDPASGERTTWHAGRVVPGVLAFSAIGFVGGLFGLGAGWANVPAFNLLMGVPLKLAAGTSGLVISIVNTPAAWVYFLKGSMLPVIVAPSLLGVMLGAQAGARLFRVMPARQIRLAVIVLLLFAGTRVLLKGLGLWS
jgi:uncharacterized membrane protein YfcA